MPTETIIAADDQASKDGNFRMIFIFLKDAVKWMRDLVLIVELKRDITNRYLSL